MPTLRSEFSIEQFEVALQKLAHALPKFHKVTTEDMEIYFYYDERGKRIRRIHVGMTKKTGRKTWEREYFGFTIEPKAYTDSPDNTRISFNYKGEEEKILQWLKELMGFETPTPRFSLEKYVQQG